jgi:hypothetical protein
VRAKRGRLAVDENRPVGEARGHPSIIDDRAASVFRRASCASD